MPETKEFQDMTESELEEYFQNFKKEYDSLNPEIKKRLAKVLKEKGIILTTREQIETIMKLSKAFSIMLDLT